MASSRPVIEVSGGTSPGKADGAFNCGILQLDALTRIGRDNKWRPVQSGSIAYEARRSEFW